MMSISTTQKIKNFIKALYTHIKTGMKKSSQKLINDRYSICTECKYFNFVDRFDQPEIKATCNQCGCNLSDKKIFMNKLAWKDQKCPIGKW
jgi:uncharacterized paraquat-inducible protein A